VSRSARTLLWAALVLLLVGGMVGAPEAGVACSALAALCALPAVISGPRRIRIVAVAVLVAAAALASALLPGARGGLESYRNRAQRQPSGPAAAPQR
jgi:membrane protein implicated in regulation of membrane protease activity